MNTPFRDDAFTEGSKAILTDLSPLKIISDPFDLSPKHVLVFESASDS